MSDAGPEAKKPTKPEADAKTYPILQFNGGGAVPKWTILDYPHLVACDGPGPVAPCVGKKTTGVPYTAAFSAIGNHFCVRCAMVDPWWVLALNVDKPCPPPK